MGRVFSAKWQRIDFNIKELTVFKKILMFPKLVVLCVTLMVLYSIVSTLHIIDAVIRITVIVAVMIMTLPLSIVARLIGFLAFTIVNGVTRGYVVTKDEMSKVADRLNTGEDDET